MTQGPGQPSPILSLTLLEERSLEDGVIRPDSRVLVVARRAETNPTHPNVVSVPTQRVPLALRAAILSSAEQLGSGPDGGTVYFTGGAVDSDSVNGHHPVIYAVEALLARKLGLADNLERNRCHFRAALRTCVSGVALYDNIAATNVYEPVDMLNVVVVLSSTDCDLPIATSSYSPIAWTSVKSFLTGVENRDPAQIDPRLDPIQFCVHGVCLQAAQASLDHLLDRAVFPDYDPGKDADGLFAAPNAPYLMEGAMGSRKTGSQL